MAAVDGLVARRRGTVETEEGLQGSSSRRPLLTHTEVDQIEDHRGGFLRVRVTGYRLLTSAIILSFGASKAIQSFRGNGSTATWLEWVSGTVFAAFLYWLSFYEAVQPPVLPWFFREDYAEDVLLLLSGSVLIGGVICVMLSYFMVNIKLCDWAVSWINFRQMSEGNSIIFSLILLPVMIFAYIFLLCSSISLTTGVVALVIIIVMQTAAVLGKRFPQFSVPMSRPLDYYLGRIGVRTSVNPFVYGGVFCVTVSVSLSILTPWLGRVLNFEGGKHSGKVYV